MIQLYPTDGKYIDWLYRVTYNKNKEIEITGYGPYYKDDFIICSLTDKELGSFILPDSFCKGDIQNRDSVFISKDIIFPKSLIKNSGIAIKRVIKKEKADKIVISNCEIHNYEVMLNAIGPVYILFGKMINHPNAWPDPYHPIYISKKVLEENKKSLNDVINDIENNAKVKWKYSNHIEGYILPKNYQFDYTNKSKYVSFLSLVKFFNSKMPKLTCSQKATINSLFKSRKQENIQLAVNILQTVDLSDILADIFMWFTIGRVYLHIENKILNSINFKYILSILRIPTMSEIKDVSFNNYMAIGTLSYLYHSNLLSEEQKIKIWIYFKKAIKGSFTKINEPLTTDDKSRFNFWKIPLKIENENKIIESFNKELENYISNF